MRFQIVLASILGIAIQLVSAKKGNFKNGFKPTQSVKMDNTAKSNANSMAVRSGFCGDANASSFGSATNANLVSQEVGGKKCKEPCEEEENECH